MRRFIQTVACCTACLVVAFLSTVPAGSGRADVLCVPSDLVRCDIPEMQALSRLLRAADPAALSDLGTVALIGDYPVAVAARAGMAARAMAEAGMRPMAWRYLSEAKPAVFISNDWVVNAVGLGILAQHRRALGDPNAVDTLRSTRIDWPTRFSVADRVLFLRELGYGLAQIGEREAARKEFERARHEAAAAPDSPARQEDDGIYALVQLWDYARTIDGFEGYAATLRAEIVEALSSRPSDREFWPKSVEDLERR